MGHQRSSGFRPKLAPRFQSHVCAPVSALGYRGLPPGCHAGDDRFDTSGVGPAVPNLMPPQPTLEAGGFPQGAVRGKTAWTPLGLHKPMLFGGGPVSWLAEYVVLTAIFQSAGWQSRAKPRIPIPNKQRPLKPRTGSLKTSDQAKGPCRRSHKEPKIQKMGRIAGDMKVAWRAYAAK